MFRLTAPSDDEVRNFLLLQQHSVFSYSEVGASAGKVPSRYNVDLNCVLLGKGEAVWNRAVSAIQRWEMFHMPWIRLYWPTSVIQVGTNVAIEVCHWGFHSLNACRIVYTVDDNGPVARYGFAYGTLVEHAESGEERFTVEWTRDDDEVWYKILAFSRPQKALSKIGYPLSRMLQRRFAEDSKVAMFTAAGDAKLNRLNMRSNQ